VQFNDNFARANLEPYSGILAIEISCRGPVFQLSSVTQAYNSSLHPFPRLRTFTSSINIWANDAIKNTLWLELLLPFTAVENLYLSNEFAPGVVLALRELVGDRMTEVLPNLQNIFVEWLKPQDRFQKCIRQFVAARQLSGHPIAISGWVIVPERRASLE
jgi:hypothetical protein